MARLVLEGLTKTYPGAVAAVAGVDLEVADGELFVVVGPSGSGKSTLLRLIAGLETPTAGRLWIGSTRAEGLPPRDRDVAMVFQHAALYPYLTVFGNLAFGLRARGYPKREAAEKVRAAADRLGLGAVLDRYPATLSGGQRQRVALGRAIVRAPRVLLLDEPLSSLDAPLRAAVRAELVNLHRKLGTTMVHVTHDQAEAMALGDRIAVMDQGRLVQAGPPLEVYRRPASRFVAEFIGSPPTSVLPCVVEREPSQGVVRIAVVGRPDGDAWTVPESAPWLSLLGGVVSGRVDLGVRPEQVAAAASPEGSSTWLTATAEVVRAEPLGHETIATVMLGAHGLTLRMAAGATPRVGERVVVRIDPSCAVWFDAATGAAIESTRR